MDRLADISRPAPTSRSDANDFTRSKSTRSERPERRDEVESRSEDRVNERERPERSNEKQERFSLHLEEQQASLTPAAAMEEASAEAQTQSTRESEPESPDVASKADGKTQAKPTTAKADPAPSLEVATEVETAAVALPGANGDEPEPKAAKTREPIAPPVLLPAALPVTNETQAAVATKPSDLEPTLAVAPRVELEKPKLELDNAAKKLDAPKVEAPTNQSSSQGQKTEAALQPAKVAETRETPAARSAQEVERAADILRQIRVQITPQLSEARIHLQPIELGRISIHLTVEEGRVKTTVRAEKQETLQAIQTHLPELRASMRQHGIDAQEFTLSLGFEKREPRDGDKAPSHSGKKDSGSPVSAIERSPALHAALAKTGVDFYA
jgi:flagellar hook-length control protein FliK